MSVPITLTQLDTPGTYATDANGTHWTTFTMVGRVVSPATCAVCGAPITGGWKQSVLGKTVRYVCDAHVVLRRAS